MLTMKISLIGINHLNTMIRENKAEKNNVINEQETTDDIFTLSRLLYCFMYVTKVMIIIIKIGLKISI